MENRRMTLITDQSVDVVEIIRKLRRLCQADLVSVLHRKKVEPEKERADKQPTKEDQNMVFEAKLSGGEALSVGPVSRTVSTSGADNCITTAVNKRTQGDDWYSFCEFLKNRLRPLTLSGCRAKDAIDFLRMGKTSTDSNVLVRRLRAGCEAYGIKPKDNPFRSLAVITYLKEAREATRETECILFVSSNGILDVEETSFNEAILTELYERDVTPLTYNLSGRGNLDADMLYRSSVAIIVLSNSARSSQSLDQLVAVMDHWKEKDLVIIPVYFKVTLSDIFGLEGQFEAGRVQKWKLAMTEMASIDGHQWSKG